MKWPSAPTSSNVKSLLLFHCRDIMRFLGGGYILLCLVIGIQTQTFTFNLDMSINAFDDQYEGCTDQMEEEVITKLLNEEKKDIEFGRTWDMATSRWRTMRLSVPQGFKDEYGIAIMAYTNYDSKVFSDFNTAVRNFKPYTFKYHSLHFFLTRGVRLLRSSCWWKPWEVYRGLSGVNFYPPTIGENIRFGQFSSSSTNKTIAENFGKDTFFTISSCFGVDVKKFSYKPKQEEILIPVDEILQVTNYTKEENNQRYILKTTKKRCHYYNCEYLQRGGPSSSCVESEGMRILSSPVVISLVLCILASSPS
ncbi:ecto-ADP-ribosyltransferase 5-like [Bufo bufo]|uniref:ecto-ADP-ribosyltransferase 5-like n=1 Tax=Bufo bufo TaxID=8384 RepID=UPI001ABE5649|nr:ecto-ADP-ribosyltransferase 5-like [Bufo bufo]